MGKRNVYLQANVLKSTKFDNVILDMNLKLLTYIIYRNYRKVVEEGNKCKLWTL